MCSSDLGAAELETSGAQTLQEGLRRLPGLNLSDEQGNRFQLDLSLRGFTASPVTGVAQGLSVFVDGVRVNEPAVEEVNFDLIPLEDVERVEIVRGASPVFGRNTLGGAVNIVTRRGGRSLEAEAEAEAGSWAQQGVRGHVSGPLGPLDGYLSAGELTERGRRLRMSGRHTCGLRARQYYWHCPACAAWETYSPRRTEEAKLPA